MNDDQTFSDCRCGASDERILIERCTATWRILGDVYVVYCEECGEAESFVSMDRNDASALNGYARHAWNTRPAPLASRQYAEANPLGGAASMLETAARRIRAGEDFHEVLADYDLHSVAALLRDAGDAARYRWLRSDSADLAPLFSAGSGGSMEMHSGDELDAALDAAMHAPGGATTD